MDEVREGQMEIIVWLTQHGWWIKPFKTALPAISHASLSELDRVLVHGKRKWAQLFIPIPSLSNSRDTDFLS